MARYYRRKYRRSRRRSGPDIPLPVVIMSGVVAVFFLVFSQLGFGANDLDKLAVVLLSVVVAISLGFLGYLAWIVYRRSRRLKALQLVDIDHMSGYDFEHYVAALLNHRGCQKVKVTPKSGDFGADILFEKNGVTYAAQVKRFKIQVGVDALYQAAGGRDYYKCQRAAVITNSFFTKAARQHAQQTEAILVNREKLGEWILDFE